MRALYIVTIFVSSSLLFLIEPMVAKMILPKFGGSPGVWNTAMLFYQGMLLLGYGYAHLSTKLLGARNQSLLHVVILVGALATLPFEIPKGYGPSLAIPPAFQVLSLLTVKVGLVFFAISAGAPLLQRWFSDTKDREARDPYFLYAASNLGSMIALISYPLVVEPGLRLGQQSLLWSEGFGLMVLLVIGCATVLWKSPKVALDTPPTNTLPEDVSNRTRLKWTALAFVPSSLLLGVTTFMTSTLAPVPLLWVIPLAIYLLTFILAFSRWNVPTVALGRWLCVMVVPLAVAMLMEIGRPIMPLCGLHLATFAVAALMCHGELVRTRPSASRLTEFYFWISLGGVLGGLLNAIVSPSVFSSVFEYPLALVLACLLRPTAKRSAPTWIDVAYAGIVGVVLVVALRLVSHYGIPYDDSRRSGYVVTVPAVLAFLAINRPWRFSLALLAVFGWGTLFAIGSPGRLVKRERTFFGVYRILRSGHFIEIINGATLHGAENVLPAYRDVPLTYYHRTSPIGDVFRIFADDQLIKRAAFVGMGSGTLAAYGRPGDTYTFYEIDPAVVGLASDASLFTFLQDSKAQVNVVVGDARLTMQSASPNSYGLIVLDAFSGDNIPVHLLTREAVSTYLEKLGPHGIIVFHISNNYVDLRGVLQKVNSSLNLCTMVKEDDGDDRPETPKAGSLYLLAARDWADFKGILSAKGWVGKPKDLRGPVWTDDYSNVARALTWRM